MPATPIRVEINALDLAEEWRDYKSGKTAREGRPEPQIDIGGVAVWDMKSLSARPAPIWLIDQLVEEKGLTVFFGPDKAGKTAMLSSMLWAWASEMDWWFDPVFQMHDGRDPKPERDQPPYAPRRVLYLLLEGQASYWERFAAWKYANGLIEDPMSFFVIDTGVQLFSKGMQAKDPERWSDDLKAVSAIIAQFRPHILVVDTLSRATAGMDENSSEMAQVVAWFDMMRDMHGCATVVVHHTALDRSASSRPRGHSSLKGAASSYVRIEKVEEEHRPRLVVGPHRNAEAVNKSYANQVGYPFEMKPMSGSFHIEPATFKRVEQHERAVEQRAEKLASVVGMNVTEAALVLDVKPKTVYNKVLETDGFRIIDGVIRKLEAKDPEEL